MERDVAAELASGLEVRRGLAPLVLYAPHGGRRVRPVLRGDSVNDLHTAEIALELADRLDASAVVNACVDRNRADLNRVSVLAGPGSAALRALRELVEHATGGSERSERSGHEDAAVPLVLLVHGWNVTLPACDVGVGLVERAGRLTGAHPTVSRATLEGFVRRLAGALEARGIEAPLGRRYPAAGRDNGTQLFSGRHAAHANADVAALSELARLGRVDAVQLELAIPLRWPGRYRRAFIEAVVEAAAEERRRGRAFTAARRDEWRAHFADAAPASAPSSAGAAAGAAAGASAGGLVLAPSAPAPKRAEALESGWSLQAVLPDGGGLFAGAEPTSATDAAARLCLVRPDGRMLLFVGEGDWGGDEHRHRIGGFELTAGVVRSAKLPVDAELSGGSAISEGSRLFEKSRTSGAAAGGGGVQERGRVTLTYHGPMVVYPSHDAFCDLERGLAGAVLTEAAASLSFEQPAQRDGGFGRLTGTIHGGGESIDLDVLAVCERGSRRGGGGRPHERVFVTSGPLAPAAAVAGNGATCEWRPAGGSDVEEIVLRFDDGRRCVARVLTRVPVYRPLAAGVVVKVTFGTAAVRDGSPSAEHVSLALFERIELMAPDAE